MGKAQCMAPAHPGEVLKGLYLDPLEKTVTQAAAGLGISRRTLSMLINGRLSVNTEMALRLSQALNTTPDLWLNMQQSFDLWQAKRNMPQIHVQVMHHKKPVDKINIPLEIIRFSN